MARLGISGVLILVCAFKCQAMSHHELEDFADFLKKTSQLSPTLKKGAEPEEEYDEDEPVSDHAWEESGKFEGDLILNERQRRLIVENVAEGLSRNGITDGTKRWPNNEVIYFIQREHFTSDQVQAIQNGIEDLAQASCVKFRPYRKGDRDAVVIQGSRRGCFSQVGYQGGYQVLNLSGRHPVGRGCFRHGTVIHEMLHTLGFYHMQSSPDRDDYVNVIWENIIEQARHNFRKYNSFAVSDFGVGYDYDSVLHYSRRAFSTNGKDTIVPKKRGATIGQRLGLSSKDTEKLNRMYCDAGFNEQPIPPAADEAVTDKPEPKKKTNTKNKPFDGQGIGYHQGKAVVIKLLPAAETYKLADVPSFHVFDYFSKAPQALQTSEIQGLHIGTEIIHPHILPGISSQHNTHTTAENKSKENQSNTQIIADKDRNNNNKVKGLNNHHNDGENYSSNGRYPNNYKVNHSNEKRQHYHDDRNKKNHLNSDTYYSNDEINHLNDNRHQSHDDKNNVNNERYNNDETTFSNNNINRHEHNEIKDINANRYHNNQEVKDVNDEGHHNHVEINHLHNDRHHNHDDKKYAHNERYNNGEITYHKNNGSSNNHDEVNSDRYHNNHEAKDFNDDRHHNHHEENNFNYGRPHNKEERNHDNNERQHNHDQINHDNSERYYHSDDTKYHSNDRRNDFDINHLHHGKGERVEHSPENLSENLNHDLNNAFHRLSKMIKLHVNPSQAPNLDVYKISEDYGTISRPLENEHHQTQDSIPLRKQDQNIHKKKVEMSVGYIKNVYISNPDEPTHTNIHNVENERREKHIAPVHIIQDEDTDPYYRSYPIYKQFVKEHFSEKRDYDSPVFSESKDYYKNTYTPDVRPSLADSSDNYDFRKPKFQELWQKDHIHDYIPASREYDSHSESSPYVKGNGSIRNDWVEPHDRRHKDDYRYSSIHGRSPDDYLSFSAPIHYDSYLARTKPDDTNR